MLGRELIIYILKNGLENEDVFEIIKSLPTIGDVAVTFGVGTATVEVWLENGCLDGVEFNGVTYISPTSLDKFAEKRSEEMRQQAKKELKDV